MSPKCLAEESRRGVRGVSSLFQSQGAKNLAKETRRNGQGEREERAGECGIKAPGEKRNVVRCVHDPF